MTLAGDFCVNYDDSDHGILCTSLAIPLPVLPQHYFQPGLCYCIHKLLVAYFSRVRLEDGNFDGGRRQYLKLKGQH